MTRDERKKLLEEIISIEERRIRISFMILCGIIAVTFFVLIMMTP